MKKKWLIGAGIVGVLAVVVLAGGLVTGALAQGPGPAAPSQQTTITPEQAKDAALAANPGTAVVNVDLDNDGGTPVYEVELDSGQDVLVDANSGAILDTKQGEGAEGAESAKEESDQAGDTDNTQSGVQEEVENQAENAQEVPQAQDTSGQ